eukprot:75303-Pelagomonas_calceolata.AAC.2
MGGAQSDQIHEEASQHDHYAGQGQGDAGGRIASAQWGMQSEEASQHNSTVVGCEERVPA